MDEQEIRTVVSRGLSLARLFNLREGMTSDDDRLPQRLHEPMLKGPLSDKRLSKEEVRTVRGPVLPPVVAALSAAPEEKHQD